MTFELCFLGFKNLSTVVAQSKETEKPKLTVLIQVRCPDVVECALMILV